MTKNAGNKASSAKQGLSQKNVTPRLRGANKSTSVHNQAEEALRKSEEKYKALVETIR